ncbi:hypothetical protein [Methylobacterium sp. D54C]|jgi:hypothetical protein
MNKKLKPVFSQAESEGFAMAANPHQWLLSASNLHDQATALHAQRGRGYLQFTQQETVRHTWDEVDRATFLLCAFALENMIKSFLIYEHPNWVSDGYLANDICSHRLVQLGDKSTLMPYRRRDRWVLAAFEEGNESWMRYPCGCRAGDIRPAADMHNKLWTAYQRVMRGCGAKMISLLSKGWVGPYGSPGRWKFQGDWFA